MATNESATDQLVGVGELPRPAVESSGRRSDTVKESKLELLRQWLLFGPSRRQLFDRAMASPGGSIEVSFTDLALWNPDLADDMLAHPEEMLEVMEEALRTAALPIDRQLGQTSVRVTDLPDTVRVEPGGYSPSDPPSKFLSISGQVANRTTVSRYPTEIAWECQRCGTMTYIPQPTFGGPIHPHECQGCERQGPFRSNEDQSQYEDRQLAILESRESAASQGETDQVTVVLMGDVCGHQAITDCQQVRVAGWLEQTGDPINGERVLVANSITSETVDYREVDLTPYEPLFQRVRENPGEMFQQCLASVAPAFETGGYRRDEQVKKALWLHLFGGHTFDGPNGAHYRGEAHLLLLGDPGVGKSVLTKWASEIAPKAAYHAGSRTSGPGLSAAIVGDSLGDSEFTVAPGALVRGHKGHTVVDELDKAPDDAVEKCHTALEDQIIPLSMAGQRKVLPAQTALLAAANPEQGDFDPGRSVVDQVDLKPPMLSRFDLLLCMRSKEDRDRVQAVSESMLERWQLASKAEAGEPLTDAERETVEGPLSPDQMRAILMKGKRLQPRLSDAAQRAIADWFTEQKMALPERYAEGMEAASDGGYDGPPLPLTARKQAACRRLAEASARAHLRETITLSDVQHAKELVSRTLADLDIPPVSNAGVGGGGVTTTDPTQITGV